MRVFVAGATGVAGKRAVARLVAAGHDVTGIARTPDKAAVLEMLGAAPVAVDLFDADALRAAVAGHDAVVNMATKIPPIARATRERARGPRTSGSAGWRRDSWSTRRLPPVRRCSCRSRSRSSTASTATEWVDAATTPMMDDPTFTEACAIAERNVARVTGGGRARRGVALRALLRVRQQPLDHAGTASARGLDGRRRRARQVRPASRRRRRRQCSGRRARCVRPGRTTSSTTTR